MIRLMACDGTYTKYLSEKQAKEYWAKKGLKEQRYEDLDVFQNDLGLPMLDKTKQEQNDEIE